MGSGGGGVCKGGRVVGDRCCVMLLVGRVLDGAEAKERVGVGVGVGGGGWWISVCVCVVWGGGGS